MNTVYIIGGFLIGIVIGIVIVRFLLKNNTSLEIKELKDSIKSDADSINGAFGKSIK